MEKKSIIKAISGGILILGIAGILSGCKITTNPPQPTPGPVEEEKIVTIEDMNELDSVLQKKFGTIEGYQKEGKDFYVYAKKNENISLHKIALTDKAGLETNFQVDELIENINDARDTEIATFSDKKEYVEYDGFKYNLEGIKGVNIFAERVGVATSQNVTKVEMSVDGNMAKMKIACVTANKTVIADLETQIGTVEEMISNFMDANLSTMSKQEINLGMDIYNFSAEKPVEVEKGEIIEQERPCTVEEMNEFSELLESKIAGSMIDWSIQDNYLYVFDQTLTGVEINFCNILEGEGIETNFQLKKLSESIGQYGFMNYMKISDISDSIVYDGYEYFNNSIGAHPFYPSANIDTRISVQKFDKILDESSSTGYSVVAKYIVGENDQTKAVYVRRDIPETATLADMVTAVQSAQGVTSILNDKTDILKESQIVYHAPQEVIADQTIDFTALENKLVEIGNEIKRGYSLNNLLNCSVSNEGLYIIVDISNSLGANLVNVYSSTGNFDVSTQDGIDDIVANISADDFTEVVSIKKSTSDITANGETYSKDGIEGDNAFARQCGVDNAIMTWVSGLGNSIYSDFDTGYEKNFYVLTLSKNNNNELVVNKFRNAVECDAGDTYTNEKLYSNFFEEGKYFNYVDSTESFNLGQNLKPEEEAVQTLSTAPSYTAYYDGYTFTFKQDREM